MKMKIVEKPLWLRIIIGLVLGIAAGVALSPGVGLIGTEDMLTLAPWVALPGNLFLSLVKMIMMPLVLSSIVLGISSSGDKSFLGRAASRVVPYFVMTTVVAVSIGALVATAMEPGKHFDKELVAQLVEGSPKADQAPPPVAEREDLAIPDRIVRLIPTNYIQSRLDQDVLATVIIGLFLGTAMVFAAPKKVTGLGDFFVGLQEVSLRIVDWAMMLAPLAVFSLICQVVMRVGLDAVLGMAAYMASVLIGLLLLVVFYMILVFVLGRRSPIKFLRAIYPVQLLAFSTSSSAAVMPLSLSTAEEKLGADKSVVSFIIPLGATVNMDGTALYQVAATVFLTQVYGIDLGIAGLAAVAATTVAASIGTPSTPGVGIVVLATILQGVGVPPSGVALILGVDRILDMCRTSVNVTGDLTAVTIMDRWLGKSKQKGGETEGETGGLSPSAAP